MKILRKNKATFMSLEKELGINLEHEMEKIKGIRRFDRLISIRAHGFQSVDDYYRRCSLGVELPQIKIPTLIFSSLDDPAIP